MTPATLASYIRTLTRTNSATFPDASMVTLLKVVKDDIVLRAKKANADIFVMPHYTDLVFDAENSVPQREYGFPADILATMKRVEAKLNGTDWVKLLAYDSSLYHGTHDETAITQNFGNNYGSARYELRRNALFLYTGTFADVHDGLMLMCSVYPSDITDLSSDTDMSVDPTPTTCGIPRELHELIGRGVSIIWKGAKDKPIPLNEREQKYEYDLQQTIIGMSQQSEEEDIIAELPDSSDIGNDGFDY